MYYFMFTLVFLATALVYLSLYKTIKKTDNKNLTIVFIINLLLSGIILFASYFRSVDSYYISHALWNKYDMFVYVYAIPILQIAWAYINSFIIRKLFIKNDMIASYIFLYAINLLVIPFMLLVQPTILGSLNDTDTFTIYSIIISIELFIFLWILSALLVKKLHHSKSKQTE